MSKSVAIISKRRKCLADLTTQGANVSAVERVLHTLADAGELAEDFPTSSSSLQRAGKELLDERTQFGPVVTEITMQLIKGQELQWPVVNPYSYVWWVCENVPAYAKMLVDALEKHPSSPDQQWHLCLYGDEAVGGNVLKVDNGRKAWCMYWQFLEIDEELLHHEALWNVGAVLRTRTSGKTRRGLSGALSCLMSFWFGDVQNLGSGLRFRYDDKVYIIFAELGRWLSDEGFLHAAFLCKGASGWRYCMLCSNLVSERSGLAGLADGSLVPHGCNDVTRLQLHIDASIWSVVDKTSQSVVRHDSRKKKRNWVFMGIQTVC